MPTIINSLNYIRHIALIFSIIRILNFVNTQNYDKRPRILRSNDNISYLSNKIYFVLNLLKTLGIANNYLFDCLFFSAILFNCLLSQSIRRLYER